MNVYANPLAGRIVRLERENARLRAALEQAQTVLRGYEAWEAAVLRDPACWPDFAPAIICLGEDHYDRLIALQVPRNAALAAAPGTAGE